MTSSSLFLALGPVLSVASCKWLEVGSRWFEVGSRWVQSWLAGVGGGFAVIRGNGFTMGLQWFEVVSFAVVRNWFAVVPSSKFQVGWQVLAGVGGGFAVICENGFAIGWKWWFEVVSW
jgi:hypothetical protein